MKITELMKQRKNIILNIRFVRMELSYNDYHNAVIFADRSTHNYDDYRSKYLSIDIGNNDIVERHDLPDLISNLAMIIKNKSNGMFTAKGINLNIHYIDAKNDLRTLQFDSNGHVDKLIAGLKHLISSYLKTIDEYEYYRLALEQSMIDNGNTRVNGYEVVDYGPVLNIIYNHPLKNSVYVSKKVKSFKKKLLKLYPHKSMSQLLRMSRKDGIIVNADNMKRIIKLEKLRPKSRPNNHNSITISDDDLPF